MPIYDLIPGSSKMGQNLLYNPPTTGVKSAEEVAAIIESAAFTPERANGDPKRSGPREVWAKQVKDANKDVQFALYSTSHSGMKADKKAFSNQPFHDGELSRLLDKYPNMVLRDPAGNPLEKGSNGPGPMYLIDPAFMVDGQYLIITLHERNIREVLERAPGLFVALFWDDFGVRFINWQGKGGEIVPTLQYGDPYSDKWWQVFSAHMERLWELCNRFKLPMWVNMSSMPKYNETRFRPMVRRLARRIQEVPTRFMHEYFVTSWDGKITADSLEESMQEANIVFEEGGLQLFRPKIAPWDAVKGGKRYEDACLCIFAGQIMNSGFAQMRMASTYDQFGNVPLIDAIGELTGDFVPGPEGAPQRLGHAIWQRQFKNGILKVDGNTKTAEFIDKPWAGEEPGEGPEDPRNPVTQRYTATVRFQGAEFTFDVDLTPKS